MRNLFLLFTSIVPKKNIDFDSRLSRTTSLMSFSLCICYVYVYCFIVAPFISSSRAAMAFPVIMIYIGSSIFFYFYYDKSGRGIEFLKEMTLMPKSTVQKMGISCFLLIIWMLASTIIVPHYFPLSKTKDWHQVFYKLNK